VTGETGMDSVELVSPALPFTALFRADNGEKKIITVCTVDGSTIKGRVTEVSDEGDLAVLSDGEHDYVISIAHVCIVKTQHREG
jgi:hypothetical protein